MTTAAAEIRHRKAFETSVTIASWYYDMHRPEVSMTDPRKVIEVLNKAEVSFVLVGTHGLVGYRSESRATHDVDVVATKKDFGKARAALEHAFPKLKVVDLPAVVRFVEERSGSGVIDLIKPASKLFRAVFRHAERVGKSHRIPTLEMVLVLKWFAMTAENRAYVRRLQDATDFADIVLEQGDVIDEPKVRRIASGIKTGSAAKIVAAIRDIRAGKELRIVP